MANGSYIRTYSGRMVNPLDASPDDIDISDIARALSNHCRFLGHTLRFYSVSQHSVLVSNHVPHKDALWGLLHDAPEAYLCDLPRPLKQAPGMEPYVAAEEKLMAVIAQRYGLPLPMPESVRLADNLVLATEFRDVVGITDPGWIAAQCGTTPMRDNIAPWTPELAENHFLWHFLELTRGTR